MLKEKQLTVRASRRPVEYNYTNSDIHHADTTPQAGYQFEYPVNWTGDPSTMKVIGIRRIQYIPTSIDINFTIDIEDEFYEDDVSIKVSKVYTHQNSFEECMCDICNTINETMAAVYARSTARSRFNYNKDLGKFEFGIGPVSNKFNFKVIFGNNQDQSSKRHYQEEFLKLFNQPITEDNIATLESWDTGVAGKYITEIKYDNVWNRNTFYCHASFSDSPRQIIGINHDFWQSPSVFYAPSDNSNDFNLYFTTDTVHRILPRHGVMLIQLSYIFNYQNSMLQYA